MRATPAGTRSLGASELGCAIARPLERWGRLAGRANAGAIARLGWLMTIGRRTTISSLAPSSSVWS